ncbi:MAG: hypothetical protein WCJ56_07310, partial [bacterium]
MNYRIQLVFLILALLLIRTLPVTAQTIGAPAANNKQAISYHDLIVRLSDIKHHREIYDLSPQTISESLPYTIMYITESDQKIAAIISELSIMRKSVESIPIIIAMMENHNGVSYDGSSYVSLYRKSYENKYSLNDMADLSKWGGDEYKDILYSKIRRIGKGRSIPEPYLTLSVYNDKKTMDEIEAYSLSPASKDVIISNGINTDAPSSLICDMAMAHNGSATAIARLRVKLHDQKTDVKELMYIINYNRILDKSFIDDILMLKNDKRPAFQTRYTDVTNAHAGYIAQPDTPSTISNYIRICDIALLALVERTGADIGFDYKSKNNYTDKELDSAFAILVEAAKKLPPDSPRVVKVDELTQKIETAFRAVKQGYAGVADMLIPEGDAVLPYLPRYINNDNPDVRHALISICEHSKAQTAIAILIALANDRDAQVAQRAMTVLYRKEDQKVVAEFGGEKWIRTVNSFIQKYPYHLEGLLALNLLTDKTSTDAMAAIVKTPENSFLALPGMTEKYLYLDGEYTSGITPTALADLLQAVKGDKEAYTRLLTTVKLGNPGDAYLLLQVLVELDKLETYQALAEVLSNKAVTRKIIPGKTLCLGDLIADILKKKYSLKIY